MLGAGVRVGAAAPGRTPCPNRRSALEKAFHGFAGNSGENVIVLTLGTSLIMLHMDRQALLTCGYC